MTASINESVNVQQSEGLHGQVNSQVQTVENIVSEAVNHATMEETAKVEQLDLLQSMRITTETEVKPETYSLSVDGVGIFAIGDIHALKGKQKSGKSSVLKVLTAALLGNYQFRIKSELKEPIVLFIDTEQQQCDVSFILSEVKSMTGIDDKYINSHLLLFSFRRRSYDTLLADTRLLIGEYRPQVVFIDGLVDYIQSFNDEMQSRELIHELLVICEQQSCAIVCVLHENKGNDDANMRGHLGTVLAQKSGNVLQCKKNAQGIINVSCPDSRHSKMPEWNIYFDEDGHIADGDMMKENEDQANKKRLEDKRRAQKEKTEKERLDVAISIIESCNGSIQRGFLNSTLASRLGLSRPTISKFISQMVNDGKLIETNGGIKAPNNSDTQL